MMRSTLFKQLNTNKLWFFYLLIIGLVLSRLIPHPPNFTPIGAIGVFIGAYSMGRLLWVLPLIALVISDYLIGFYDLTSMFFVYIGVFASFLLGKWFLSKNVRVANLIGTAFASGVTFFVISNFGVWLSGQLYPFSISGLIECYIAAIPFFGNTLASNLFYTLLTFGVYEFVVNKRMQQQENHLQQL